MLSRSRTELAGLALLVLVTLALGVRHMQRQAAVRTPPPSEPAVVEREDEPSEQALVHVTGAVRSPGVYRLRTGSRVEDALRRAGGPTSRADLAAINLAAIVADAQQVVVPARPAAPSAAPGSGSAGPETTATAGPLHLGSATEAQLDELDGVGPALAARIVEERARRGGFRSIDELAEVPGIGPKRLEALREAVAP